MSRLYNLMHLARKSAWNRKNTLILIVLSIALSTTLLLGIERIRTQMQENFVQSVSGTDLIVGARGSSVQLVLYAIFHLGGVTNAMGYDQAERIAQLPETAWTIPLSLGDSHRDYPVVATTQDFYEHFRYRTGNRLSFKEGRAPTSLFHVVLGAEVAKNLGYTVETPVTLTHGNSQNTHTEHKDSPFTVCVILAPTGTPVDRTLYIYLEAMEAIHVPVNYGQKSGSPVLKQAETDLTPHVITALLVGLHKRGQVFSLQRQISAWREEPLQAVLPGVAMSQLWEMLNTGEKALMLISALVTLVGLAGLVSTVLAGLGERRRELAILRSAGARPTDILLLLAFEGGLLVVSGAGTGLLLLYALTAAIAPFLADAYGIFLSCTLPTVHEWLLMGGICLAGLVTSLIPAIRAYHLSLADGLTVSV